MYTSPAPFSASRTSRHLRLAASEIRKPASDRTDARAMSSRPRLRAVSSASSEPPLAFLGLSAVALIAASASASSGLACFCPTPIRLDSPRRVSLTPASVEIPDPHACARQRQPRPQAGSWTCSCPHRPAPPHRLPAPLVGPVAVNSSPDGTRNGIIVAGWRSFCECSLTARSRVRLPLFGVAPL